MNPQVWILIGLGVLVLAFAFFFVPLPHRFNVWSRRKAREAEKLLHPTTKHHGKD